MCLIINITRGVVWVELLIIDAAPGRACDGARKATSFYTAFTHHDVFTCLYNTNKYLTMSSVWWIKEAWYILPCWVA